jgi:DcuC family C4-dicarboxylate transporter
MSNRARSSGKPIARLIAWCLFVAVIAVALLGAQRPSPRAADLGSSSILIAAAILDLVVVAILVARGVDVRLVLLLGALPLFLATRHSTTMITKIVAEMANPGTVVPICSAVGFAYVLRSTGCDQHLVQLLLRPLRQAQLLLIPGGMIAGYVVNSTIVSQAGTAAVLGPILIPLLRASGLSATTAGAILLLGSSAGGELFNPGAVEMRKLAELTGRTGPAVVGQSAPLNLLAFSAALGAFWLLAPRRERRRKSADTPLLAAGLRAPGASPPGEAPVLGAGLRAPGGSPPSERPKVSTGFTGESTIDAAIGNERHPQAVDATLQQPGGTSSAPSPFRVNLFKAIVPVLPLVILFADHALGSRSILRGLEGPGRILAAMLIGVGAAALSSLKTSGGLATAFFEGAGYAYTHVISLIVAASTFAEAIRLSGLIELLIRTIAPWPALAMVVATIAPWALAFVAGTGIAPAVAIMEFFVPVASSIGLDPARVGTLAALGAHFGRTMSPAAAVVMVSSRLSGSSPRELIREVAGPLFVGGAVLLGAALLHVI